MALRRPRLDLALGLLLGLFALVSAGCGNLTTKRPDSINALQHQVYELKQQIAEANQSIADLGASSTDQSTEVSAELAHIKTSLKRLPKTMESVCRGEKTTPKVACPDSDNAVVVDQHNRMIVGELENLWLELPGLNIVARVDTGASSSSIHAGELIEFERDGDSWVRFAIERKGETPLVMERPVERYVRVVQQADPKGTRRPVISLSLRLGNLANTFEFTLADRAHLEYQIILGRNFLSDIALVDVSKKYVQPVIKSSTNNPVRTN